MMVKRKNLWIALLLVLALVTSGFQSPVLAAGLSNQGTISVIGSDVQNPLLTETTVQYGDKETALDALKMAVGDTNVELTNTSYGKMIKGIDGQEAKGTYYWAFYINGVAAQVGADSYNVQAGDSLSFRYIDWTKPPQNTVSLKVVNGAKNTTNDLKGIAIIGQPTALQFLQVALGSDKVGLTETKYGKMITSINGINAKGTNYWAFYINGKMATIGADSYKLLPNDQISYQYESWQNTPGDTTNTENNSSAGGTISKAALNKAVDSASGYVVNHQVSEWEAIALNKAGKTIPTSYMENVKKVVQEKQGKFRLITDTERYTLGILAAGGDPTNIGGYNLVESIYNGNVTKQGLNGVAYALIALDSAKFKIPDSATWNRDKLLAQLLQKQNKDGGWAWDESTNSDIDTTGMILTALAPYKNQSGVKEKVDAAVQYLSTHYQNAKIDNSSTAAQVVIALSALGIDANGSLFAKENTSLVQYLLSFQNKDGGFDWKGGDVSDVFSTAEGIQGLAAYQLYATGKGPLYQLPLAAQTTVKENSTTPAVKQPLTQSVVVESNSNKVSTKGNPLPNTATNTYNLLILGSFLMMIGLVFYLREKKRNA